MLGSGTLVVDHRTTCVLLVSAMVRLNNDLLTPWSTLRESPRLSLPKLTVILALRRTEGIRILARHFSAYKSRA